MAVAQDKPYAIGGDNVTDQAQPSTANRGAGTVQMRILIELQVLSFLLNRAPGDPQEDLQQLRQDLADEIT